MKIKTKHLVITGLAGIAAIAIFGGKKAIDTFFVAEKLEVSLKGVSSIPELFGFNVRTSINIGIKNPTNTPLDISTAGLVKLTQIRIFNNKGNIAGVANPNLDGISVPANSEIVLQDIPVEGTIGGILETILSGGFTANDFTIEADFESLGQIFTV